MRESSFAPDVGSAVEQGDKSTLERTLLALFPGVYRLANGLCGDAAASVADRVLRRAVVVGPSWPAVEAAERWCLRFTVLASRQMQGSAPTGSDLAWLGSLPAQQREAVTLVHGLRLDLHRAAAAMDCSSRAVANHLVAAMGRLREAGNADDQIAALPARLAAVVPPSAAIERQVERAVARRRWRTLVRRVGLALGAIALAVGGWAGYRVWQMLVF